VLTNPARTGFLEHNPISARNFPYCGSSDQKILAAKRAVISSPAKTFQPTHPHSEIKFMIARDKEMHVIGHYHVTPNHHVMIQPSFRVINESTMDASVSQNFPPTRCAKRDRKKRRIINLEYSIQPQRLIMTHFTGCSCRLSV
jgi:hypothetical protein